MITLLMWAFVGASPTLPATDGAVKLPAQEWRVLPGPRAITAYIHYPGGALNNIRETTGLMLCLHNWGGTGSIGSPDPVQVANRYDVVAICVDYLQSGKWSSTAGAPYDFGYLQALDALRALHFVFDSLDAAQSPFARGRIYACGGSGGGNVALMANKLAPRTFACVVDISGMTKLSDDIAFGLPAGSELNAAYSRDSFSPAYLSPDAQQLRDAGAPTHLNTMKDLGNTAMVVVIHGTGDTVCSADDARGMSTNMHAASLDVEANFLEQTDVDGETITNIGHSLGDRTKLLIRFADNFLLPTSDKHRVRSGKTDFEYRDENVRYKTENGEYVISYAEGFPVGRFERLR